jgi:hypothetical protein
MLLTHFPLPPNAEPTPPKKRIDWALVWLAAFVIFLVSALSLLWHYYPQSLGS